MKKSELRRLVSEYVQLRQKLAKSGTKNSDNLAQIEHRYFHETGRSITDAIKESIPSHTQDKI